MDQPSLLVTDDTVGCQAANAMPPGPIDGFISTFKKHLEQPVILSPPTLRKTRTTRQLIDEDDLVPKRSARLAAKSRYRESKLEAQARKVMMKRIGLEVETVKPDQTAFTAPLSKSTREAMHILFPGGKQRAARTVSAT